MGYDDGFYLLKWKEYDRELTFGRWDNYENRSGGTFDVIGSDEIFNPEKFSEIRGPICIEDIYECYSNKGASNMKWSENFEESGVYEAEWRDGKRTGQISTVSYDEDSQEIRLEGDTMIYHWSDFGRVRFIKGE
jgi:hypothetical protein